MPPLGKPVVASCRLRAAAFDVDRALAARSDGGTTPAGSYRKCGSRLPNYERTLNTMGVADRRAWGERVAAQLAEAVPDLSRVVFLAGERYREFLARHLAGRGVAVSVPMEGLRIGEQLSWLGQHSPQPAV